MNQDSTSFSSDSNVSFHVFISDGILIALYLPVAVIAIVAILKRKRSLMMMRAALARWFYPLILAASIAAIALSIVDMIREYNTIATNVIWYVFSKLYVMIFLLAYYSVAGFWVEFCHNFSRIPYKKNRFRTAVNGDLEKPFLDEGSEDINPVSPNLSMKYAETQKSPVQRVVNRTIVAFALISVVVFIFGFVNYMVAAYFYQRILPSGSYSSLSSYVVYFEQCLFFVAISALICLSFSFFVLFIIFTGYNIAFVVMFKHRSSSLQRVNRVALFFRTIIMPFISSICFALNIPFTLRSLLNVSVSSVVGVWLAFLSHFLLDFVPVSLAIWFFSALSKSKTENDRSSLRMQDFRAGGF